MKFVIRKTIEQEWVSSCGHKVLHREDKIYLKPYTYQDALKRISIIYEDIEEQYNLYTHKYITICKWDIRVMLVPVSEKFKGQNNWINTESFLKYKG